jgi:hypothetical protein
MCRYETIDNTMEIDQVARNGSYANALEKCYLYIAVKTGIDLNEFHTDTQNTTFDALMQQYQPISLPTQSHTIHNSDRIHGRYTQHKMRYHCTYLPRLIIKLGI